MSLCTQLLADLKSQSPIHWRSVWLFTATKWQPNRDWAAVSFTKPPQKRLRCQPTEQRLSPCSGKIYPQQLKSLKDQRRLLHTEWII